MMRAAIFSIVALCAVVVCGSGLVQEKAPDKPEQSQQQQQPEQQQRAPVKQQSTKEFRDSLTWCFYQEPPISPEPDFSKNPAWMKKPFPPQGLSYLLALDVEGYAWMEYKLTIFNHHGTQTDLGNRFLGPLGYVEKDWTFDVRELIELPDGSYGCMITLWQRDPTPVGEQGEPWTSVLSKVIPLDSN